MTTAWIYNNVKLTTYKQHKTRKEDTFKWPANRREFLIAMNSQQNAGSQTKACFCNLPVSFSDWHKTLKVAFFLPKRGTGSRGSKWVIGCFTAHQQQRSSAPTLGVGSFRSYPGHTRTSCQTETQQIKSPLNTIQRDTAYTSGYAYVPKPDWRETQQFAVSMHNLRIYLEINNKTTLVCLHDENTHANLPAN